MRHSGFFLAALILGLEICCSRGEAHPSASEVLVVYNRNSPISTAVARDYITKRHITHIVTVTCLDSAENSANETIDYSDYVTEIAAPVSSYLAKHQGINFIVLTKGMPIRINGALTGEGSTGKLQPSLDSYLAAIDYPTIPGAVKANLAGSGTVGTGWINRYYNATVPFSHVRFGGYLVTRLDGYTQTDAESLVRRALQAERSRPDGYILFDVEPDFGLGDKRAHPLPEPLQMVTSEESYSDWNADMLHASDILEASGVSHITAITHKFVGGQTNLAGYYSWGSNDDGFNPNSYESLTFAPGSIGDTAVSTSARTFLPTVGGQTLIDDLVAHGLTCCQGYSGEPILDGISSPTIDLLRYLSGSNMAESFYAGTKYVGWEGVCIGDPLCCPYPTHKLVIPIAGANYRDCAGGITTEACGESGLDLCNISNNSYTSYPNVNFGGKHEFVARVSSSNGGGTIEVRLDSAAGSLVGSCGVPSTGDRQSYVTQTCKIGPTISGLHTVFLVYRGGSGDLFNVEWFALRP